MTNQKVESSSQNSQERQPSELRELLRSINAARSQSSLYGMDHPNTQTVIQNLAAPVKDFLDNFPRPTCVFAKESIVINDRFFSPTNDSIELFHRLRARGTMAVTFVSEPTAKEMEELIAFLNVEPKAVRSIGGPSSYLRKRGVSRIVATEAVYTGLGVEEEKLESPKVEPVAQDMDHAVGTVIKWLMKQDEESTEQEKFPVNEILSSPDKAAKLITEAVTKLHASRRQSSQQKLTEEVLHNLKDFSSSDQEGWDKATPQIRKAISKLPKEMRPSSGGFVTDVCDIEGAPDGVPITPVNVGSIEGKVTDALRNRPSGQTSISNLDDVDLNDLFSAKPSGLLSTWKEELQPSSFLASSARTLSILMIREDSADEHNQIAHSIAALVIKAVETGDHQLAQTLMENLLFETKHQNELPWRATNAKSAIQSIGQNTVRSLIESALISGGYRAKDMASSLVESFPEIALGLLDMLGFEASGPFKDALRKGIVSSGRAAMPGLGKMLRDGEFLAKEAALSTLADIGTESAVREISTVLDTADESFTLKVLRVLAKVKIPVSAEIYIQALKNSSSDVRCAAINALGQIGSSVVVPHLIRIASKKAMRRRYLAEKLEAIKALGMTGSVDVLECLEVLANRRPLFFKTGSELVRASAQQSIAQIKSSCGESKAA